MKALLLAGGLGTRLRPLTDHIPKPMVPILGQPHLKRLISYLSPSGIDEVVVTAGYRGKDIELALGDGSNLGVAIRYVHENTPLGTGGAIKNAEKHFDGTFLIFNADILSEIDVQAMLRHHKKHDAAVTIAVKQVNNPSQYGVIEYDADYRIRSFKEKPPPGEASSNWINAGVYVFEPAVLREIPAGLTVSVERETFPALLSQNHKLVAYRYEGYWLDIGTTDKYLLAHRDILDGKCRTIAGHSGSYISPTATVSPEATVVEPVYIGDKAIVDDKAVIGPHAVLGCSAYVGYGSMVIDSILLDGVKVGQNLKVINSVAGNNCRVYDNLISDTCCEF
ncbi:sugar phosphate nucleotidyltransferase [Anaeroselena agilis]|uniref:NDP-sugar synthase n=1 Tax=Anaeroselena agilis TaxID=3063788 RepID=A0ABU3NU55_9FIRM|nr:NDP-sugar synthase [Selenomonadales bacterium 4137-cl]